MEGKLTSMRVMHRLCVLLLLKNSCGSELSDGDDDDCMLSFEV